MTPEEIDRLAEEMVARIAAYDHPRAQQKADEVARYWRPLRGRPVLTAAPRRPTQQKDQDQ